ETEDPDQAAKLFARAAITSPEKAARLILRGAEKNRARILIGPDGRVMAAMPRLRGARYAAVQAYAARVTNSRSGRAGA
ncbi:acetoin dehydrogenase, partial [Mycobacterium tuberculosis]|nr:acetoin dehydrogenase [Mycobacterium tuberculosis]